MGFLSDIFDPGKQDRDRAAALGEEGIFRGGQVTGPGGISAGFDFSGGQANVNLGLGSFGGTLQDLQGLSAFGANQAQGGLPSALTDLSGRTQDRLGQINVDQFANQGGRQGLQSLFASSLKTAQADPFDLGSEISGRLRQLSERRNARRFNKFTDRLQRTGNLTSSVGTQRLGELESVEREEGLRQDLTGLQFGQSLQQDASRNVFGSFGGLEASGARQFGESFGLEQLGGNRALQQFGVGSSTFDSFLQNQRQGADIAFQGAGSAAGIAQLPLAFQQSLLQAGGAGSSTLFSAAGINQNNAQLAKSPFLEALNAAGQFAGSIQGG